MVEPSPDVSTSPAVASGYEAIMHHVYIVPDSPGLHGPASFYPVALLQSMTHRWDATVERRRAVVPDQDNPLAESVDVRAFPRLCALRAEPEDLVAMWDAALHHGLLPQQAMSRDVLAGYVHEFVQEIVDALMLVEGSFDPALNEAVERAAREVLHRTFHQAFDVRYAQDLVGDDVPDEADMPAMNAQLNRAQQRRVIVGTMDVCLHHARHHGWSG